jgi:plasmid stability protein
MAELHLTNINDAVLARLRERARQEGASLEEKVRELLEREAARESDVPEDTSQTLRMPAPDRSFRNVDPVEASGIPASELLIRDRDQ